MTQDEYFTQLNDTFWQQDDLAQQTWRSWSYQVCTEWGYIQTGNTPPEIQPLVSRAMDLEYGTYFCRASFNISSPPNVTEVNKYGAFDIEYDRLAIIGGNADPWKQATPLAEGARKRESTSNKPFHEIAHAVHHWEENGIFENQTTPTLPPNQVVYAQQFIKNFVLDWLEGMLCYLFGWSGVMDCTDFSQNGGPSMETRSFSLDQDIHKHVVVMSSLIIIVHSY
jgi:hypothetical protein